MNKIHPSAIVHPDAKLGDEVEVGAFTFIEANVEIGNGTKIGSHVGIYDGARIGNNVKIYQGVTLGALSVDKDLAETKRHPTIEDAVVIYSNAVILGGKTNIGKGSIIGGNVWLTRSIPANSVVLHRSEINFKENFDPEVLNFII